MEKIKPEVVGYVRVYKDGRRECYAWGKLELAALCFRTPKRKQSEYTHPNGKPKFRPVYKTT